MPSGVGGAILPGLRSQPADGSLLVFAGGAWVPMTASLGVLDWSRQVALAGAVSLNSDQSGKVFTCTGTSADYTVSLPTSGMRTGDLLAFVMSAALTKLVTLDASAGKTIDGQQTRVMWASEVAILEWTGTAWLKIAGKSIPMIACAVETATKIIATATYSSPDLDTYSYGTQQGMHDTTNKRMQCLRAGLYLIDSCVLLESLTGATIIESYLAKNSSSPTAAPNGAAFFPATGQYCGPAANFVLSLAVSDFVKHVVWHDKGSNAQTRSGSSVNVRCHMALSEILQW